MNKNRNLCMVFACILSLIAIYQILINTEECNAYDLVTIREIEEETKMKITHIQGAHRHKVEIYYPKTPYDVFNIEINNFINKEIKNFQEALTDITIQPNQTYLLNITYERKKYENYLSYIFKVVIDTGGAHPNTYVKTLNYDKSKDKIITIDSLIKEDENILEYFQENAFASLVTNPRAVDISMLVEGISPKKENYENFVFTETGFLLYFNPYQIAPYSSGLFAISVPYK